MKKRIISALLILTLIIGVLPGAVFAAGGLSGFVKVAAYQTGLFSDVPTSKWYAAYVQVSYEYGLINGKTADTYDPDSNITLAEAVKLASILHSIYYNGSASFVSETPWYKPYTNYALKNGIISADYADYTAPATRSEFAVILSKALPAEALAAKNTVEDNAIPDVPMEYSYSPAVYELYRAGVLTGLDAAGTYLPNTYITRAEVAAVVTRMANAAFRQTISLSINLTQEQIFNKCSPAVFYVLIYDIKGKAIKSGSGFFISSNGLAVTNYHVINGAAKAVITTADGKEYTVAGIYDYDQAKDLALLKVDGEDFPYLEMADSSKVVTGASVYAIGSPMGYKNSFSAGIISSATRTVDDKVFIQTTAAISSGSSGGALLDKTGKVIGVTAATATNAQNINLALPINQIKDFKQDNLVTLQSILPDTKYYDSYFPMPDFGAYAKAPIYKTTTDNSAQSYYYKVSDLSLKIEDVLDGYAALLEQNTFSFYGYAVEDGRIISYYANGTYGMLVTFGEKVIDGTDCIRIQILGQ
jgi:S1-C subfamily serine protease